MREISPPITRMYWARSGAVRPAIGVGEDVVPRPLLAHLLEAAVQVADLDVDVDDRLAVEAEVELHRAVRRGV